MDKIRYIFVGLCTTVINLVVYAVFSNILNFSVQSYNVNISNSISWIVSVLFAYFANKQFVYRSEHHNSLKLFLKFTESRVLTLVIETVILFAGIRLSLNDFIVKIFAQGLIIVLNYLFGKIIFNKKEDST